MTSNLHEGAEPNRSVFVDRAQQPAQRRKKSIPTFHFLLSGKKL